MPTINIKTPLAANASVNVMTDSVFELIQEPSSVSIGVAADATGVLATIQSGGDVLLEEGPVSVKTINILPVFPDDFFDDEADFMDKLVVRVRDTSGAARVVMTQVRVDPIV